MSNSVSATSQAIVLAIGHLSVQAIISTHNIMIVHIMDNHNNYFMRCLCDLAVALNHLL